MADVKISAASAVSSLLATDMLPLARSGSTLPFRVSPDIMGAYVINILPLATAGTAGIAMASSTLPVMDGVAAVGTGTTWARADHVHPASTGGTGGSASGSPWQIGSGFAVGNFYTPFYASLTNVAVSPNRIYGWPVYVPNNCTLKTLSYDCTNSPAGNLRLGLYANNNTTNMPGTLVTGTDTGSLVVASAFNSSAVLNAALTAGSYWVAFITDNGGPLYNGSGGHSALYTVLGTGGVTLGNSLAGLQPGVSSSQTYGALPSTFPTAGILNDQGQPAIILGF